MVALDVSPGGLTGANCWVSHPPHGLQKTRPQDRMSSSPHISNPKTEESLGSREVALADEDPETISLVGLADRFCETHEHISNRAFAFVLGAGASRSSGIKTADQMVRDWIRSLYREATGDAEGDGLSWATAHTLRISKYDPMDVAASYSELYQRMYRNDPERGFAYLETQMRESEPSYGYSVLARIMEATQHKVVITTNFDNLVADSLSIFSATYPLVCGHEALAAFVRPRSRRPLVVKVHRDLLLAPKSAPDDIAALPEAFAKALHELFCHYTPIVIGYGGNDGSLMALMKGLPARSIPGGVFWCYWEKGISPSSEIKKLVASQGGCLVPIPGFDETMMLLGNRLSYPVPDQLLLDRAKNRAEQIVQQAKDLKESIAPAGFGRSSDAVIPRVMGGVSEVGSRYNSSFAYSEASAIREMPSAEVKVTVELAKAILSTMQRADGQKRWWQWENLANSESDPTKKDEVYREAIRTLPTSAPLLGNYALFLAGVQKDYDAAEAMYKRAIETADRNPVCLGNYANFLRLVRKDYGTAEDMYRRAIEADGKNAINLGNYANFLQIVRKDHDAAEDMYKRAIETGNKNAAVFCKYANFLRFVRKDTDAAEDMYRRAIAIDGRNAVVLGSYATFLHSVRKDREAAEDMYKRAIEADTKNANNLGNYSGFLFSVGRVSEALPLLDSAIAIAKSSDPDPLYVELCMYAACHWLPDRWRQALSELKLLLVEKKITTGDWDFSGVITAARNLGHPEGHWLEQLASVCAGTSASAVLGGWETWQSSE